MSCLLSLDYEACSIAPAKTKAFLQLPLCLKSALKTPAGYSLPALRSALLRNYVDVSLANGSGSRGPVFADDASLTSLCRNDD